METVKGLITDYIPQRPPMVMVDELNEITDHAATSSFKIISENIFVEEGWFTEPGMLENIAQTAAAMVGYQCMLQNIPVPVGFIAAVKDLKVIGAPQVNTSIQTTIQVMNKVMDITIVEGLVKQSGEILCSCEMRILIQKDGSSDQP